MAALAKKELSCFVGGIQRFSTEDGPGIRTTVFLKGCPLKCAWCHNPELISPEFALLYKKNKCIGCGQCVESCPKDAITFTEAGPAIDEDSCDGCLICVEDCCSEALYTKAKMRSVDEIFAEIEKDRDFYEHSGGGVTLSGGEILSHAAFAAELARRCKAAGISVAADTSGFGKYEDLHTLAEISDVVLYDLKQMDEERHFAFTKVSPQRIWDNLKKLCEEETLRDKVIVRVPFIHGVNDDWENVDRLLAFMQKLGLRTVNFLPYHSMGIAKAREVGIEQEKFTTPSDDHLAAVREKFVRAGMQVTVMGKEK